MLGVQPVYVPGWFRGKLLGVGSILANARPGDIVLGSGLISDEILDGGGVSYFAIRGPLSRSNIRDADVPAIYGDPALLLPERYAAKPLGRRYGLGLVPHYVDQDVMFTSDSGIAQIDVRDNDWRRSIDLIASCDVIISSSLHGVILAESYGVPAAWMQASDRVIGAGFKFRDYYAATDREARPVKWGAELKMVAEQALAVPNFDRRPLREAAAKVAAAIAETRSGTRPLAK